MSNLADYNFPTNNSNGLLCEDEASERSAPIHRHLICPCSISRTDLSCCKYDGMLGFSFRLMNREKLGF